MNPILISTICRATCDQTSNAFRRFSIGAVLLLLFGASVSCGTMHGIGHDVETTGDVIQDAAR